MTTKVEIKMLNLEDKFVYGNKESIVLDNMEDGVLCMVLNEDLKCEFDRDNQNNFDKSTLKETLNSTYLDNWASDGADVNDFIEMQVDLTADDGLDDYGTCKCYLAPRTCDQHRKYRKLIPNNNHWEWTATPYSIESKGENLPARFVSSDGIVHECNTSCASVSVRPFFKLKPDTEVEVDTTNGVEECCLVDTMRKLVDGHGFPVVMETLAKVIAG